MQEGPLTYAFANHVHVVNHFHFHARGSMTLEMSRGHSGSDTQTLHSLIVAHYSGRYIYIMEEFDFIGEEDERGWRSDTVWRSGGGDPFDRPPREFHVRRV
jgi:hypothetical protein